MEINQFMIITETNLDNKRKGLKAKRDWLFIQFEANPRNVRMGQEIKLLDDEIAKCVAEAKE
jgi:hypothetical protein